MIKRIDKMARTVLINDKQLARAMLKTSYINSLELDENMHELAVTRWKKQQTFNLPYQIGYIGSTFP